MGSPAGDGRSLIPDSLPEEEVRAVRRAATELRSGAVVAFPTETFYALGADPRSPAAVAEVFRLKGRPGDRRLPWIAASRAQVEAVCVLPELAAALADRCWPGPVTLVLPLRGDRKDTVAVRVSSHPLARALAAALGHPVISTSANPTGAPPAHQRRRGARGLCRPRRRGPAHPGRRPDARRGTLGDRGRDRRFAAGSAGNARRSVERIPQSAVMALRSPRYSPEEVSLASKRRTKSFCSGVRSLGTAIRTRTTRSP